MMEETGVVDQNIEPAETVQRPFKHVIDLRFNGDISRDCFHGHTASLDGGLRNLQIRLAAGGDNEISSLLRQSDSDSFADTAAGAGDESDFTIEFSH